MYTTLDLLLTLFSWVGEKSLYFCPLVYVQPFLHCWKILNLNSVRLKYVKIQGSALIPQFLVLTVSLSLKSCLLLDIGESREEVELSA